MAIEKCINEFDVGDVIFEEGSTGRELYVVLDGQVEIAKVSGAAKDARDDLKKAITDAKTVRDAVKGAKSSTNG